MSDELARLLEAIQAAPEDDAPRLVYADALIERGDPRGDFIVRQCRGDDAGDLLAAHGARWIAPLGPLLMAYTFERGFLATATFAPSPERGALERAIGLPIWATVRELHGPLAVAIHPVMRALRLLDTRGDSDWRELLTGTPRAIEELHYLPLRVETWDSDGDVTATPQSGGRWSEAHSPEEIAALSTCSALPALRTLTLSGISIEKLGEVLKGPIVSRLDRIHWGSGPLFLSIAGGIATIAVTVDVATLVVFELVGVIPPRLRLAFQTPPNFHGRADLERISGARLVRWIEIGRSP